MSRLLRDPLLHFLTIGALLFATYAWLNPGSGDERRIEVGRTQVDLIVAQFEATWHRSPTPAELRTMIDRHVDDEILYREGLALGLADDDPVVKRRVRQKFEVLSEELLAGPAPTDDVLAEFLAAHRERFERPARVWFTQAMVASAPGSGEATGAWVRVRSDLARGRDPGELGVPSMLPVQTEGAALDQVAREFGRDFARELERVPLGEWSGPVTSPFGVHIVRVERREPSGLPPLDEVRSRVESEWERDRRERAQREALARLRAEYRVHIEGAASLGISAKASTP